MMSSIRIRLVIAMVACGTAIAVVGPGSAAAAQIAETGKALSITATSATLTGVVNTTISGTAYAFQYGPTTTYGTNTTPTVLNSPPMNGVNAASTSVTKLSPGTTYHFRVVVIEGGSYIGSPVTGSDATFTTPGSSGKGGGTGNTVKHGHATLRSRRLIVHRRFVSIPFRCTGAKGTHCRGTVVLSTRAKLGKSKKVRTIRCARASFSILPGHNRTVRTRVSGGCLTLLRKARGHRHGAKLRATFSTHQRPLAASVTLLRR